MKYFILFVVAATFLLNSKFGSAQTYQLVWEDNFNGTTLDSSKWNIEQKVGVWNTGGNAEFQHYKKENVTVGNDGEGNNCLILTAKKETYNGYNYTSGRVNTKGKVAFKRGKLEASIKIPNLANGLWPAFWTLGYAPNGWPDCGEIDVLEMGHKAGITAGKQNSFIGSHLFWGPYPRDYGKEFTTSQDLSKGYFNYTLIWTEKKISVYFNNAATPYFTMGIDGADAEEFRNFQHYLIFNLAVGGSVPGIFNQNEITAALPAKMYIDWVKIYQDTKDLGESNLPLYGLFGIYEDDASVDMRMTPEFDIFESANGATKNSSEVPKAGDKVLSYNVAANQDFEMKLTSGMPRNFTNYAKGSVQFYFKTNLTCDLQLGVADNSGKETFITLPAKAYTPNDKWQLAYLPVAEISSKVGLSSLKQLLILKGKPGASGYFSIDEVVFSETMPAEGYYGIYTNNPNITNKFPIDNVTGHIYNWSNTVTFNKAFPAFDGEDVLSFRSSGAANWWGFGIFSDKPINFENYANGYLNLMMRTLSKETFKIGMQGAANTSADVEFISGSDPYNFSRDGKWHQIAIPISVFTKKGLDLSACGNIFTLSGGKTADIGIDDIFLSETLSTLANPSECYAVSIAISPKKPTIKTGATKKFMASATDQFSKPTDAYVTWESSGGTIQPDGTFTASSAGVYTVTIRMGNLSDSTTVTVEKPTGISTFDEAIVINYLPLLKKVLLKGLQNDNEIVLFNLSGAVVYKGKSNLAELEINMENCPPSTYILKIRNSDCVEIRKFVNH